MVEYKIINYKDFNYSQLEDFFQKTWFVIEKPENGCMDFDAIDLKNIFKQFSTIFAVVSFDGDKLIGFVSAHEQAFCLDKESVKGLNAMFLVVLDPYRRQRIATTLMNMLQNKAKEMGFEIIVAGPEKKLKGDKVLKKIGWVFGGKFQSRVAFPNFKIIADYKGLNKIERGIGGKMASGQPDVPGIGEGFQEADESDYSQIVEILNSNPAPIKRCWTVESYKTFLENSAHYDIKSYVWKKNGKVIATGTTTVHSIHWKNG
ncbi:MAG: GNAT family N-acetyltransferase, partial [Candidatus Helarchaeota archaeon]